MGDTFDIREELLIHGATDANLKARVVDMMEEIVAEHNGECPKGATGVAEKLQKSLDNAREREKEANYNLANALQEARDLVEKLEEQNALIEHGSVCDDKDVEALNVFGAAIDAAKNRVPTALLTESVMECIIQAASYMAWRSIMGAKWPEEQQKPWKRY